MEVAALGLKIEGVEGIDRAAASLDKLTTSADKAESAGDGLSAAFKGFASNQEKMIASLSSVDHHLSEISKGMGKVGSSAKDVDPASRAMQTLDAQVLGAVNSVNLLAVSAKESGSVSAAAFNSFASQQQKTTAAVEALSGSMRELSGVSAQAGASAKRFSEFMDSSVASQRSLDSALNKLSDTLEKLSESYRKIPKEIPAPKLPPVVVPPEVPKALTDLEKRAAAAGMSVGAMSAALRGVPAQFTDIAVSLQGGMSPLTVFLQQGGQLKDMFGGAGNAARALGGYVLGLINPFSVAAAAAAALGVAYFQGSKEQDAFMVSMAKTGNAAGVTTSDLRAYSQQISDVSGTQGKAAEALNIFIDSGVRAGSSLARLTENAIAWEKATGEGVDKVAAKYVALQKDPLKAAIKLNEETNFLTLTIYDQIKSLDEEGKTAEAATVAIDALDRATAERAKTIEQSLGSIQRGWNLITGAAKKAWDAMLNVGREDTAQEKLEKATAALEAKLTQPLAVDNPAMQASREKGIANLRKEIEGLKEKTDAEKAAADAAEKNAAAVEARVAWDKIVHSTLSKSEKLELALAKVRETAALAGVTGVELEKQLNAERKKYAETTKKATGEFKTFLTSIESKIAANEAELFAAGKLTESAKLQIELDAKVKTGKLKLSEAQKALAQDAIKRLAEQEKEQKAIARSIALNDDRIASEEEMNKAMAEMDRQVNQVKIATSEYNQSISDQIEMTELETKTIGMNAQARQVLIEQLRIEQDLRKRRDAIKDAPFASDESKQYELGRLDAAGARAMALAQRKVYVTEWEKTSQLIGDTLADYIMGGGKDAASYLKRLFATLVLQPIVKANVSSLLGIGSSSDASAQGGQGLFDSFTGGTSGVLASGVSKLGSLMGSSFLGELGSGIAAGGKLGIGGTASLIGSAGGTTGAGMAIGAAAPWLAGAAVLLKVLKGFDESGTPHSGAGAIYSAAGGLQTGAGIYNQGTFGLGHPDEYSEAMQSGVSEITKGLAQTLDAFSVAFGKTAGYSVATAFADDSSKDGAWGSLKIADEVGKVLVDWGMNRESKFAPREFADGEAGYKEYLNAVAVDVKTAFVAMDLPAWADQILETATDIDTLNTALQQIATVKTAFEGLGQSMSIFSELSGEVQTKLLNASGGIESLVNSAGAFYQGFYTEGERATSQREKQISDLSGMGLYIDPGQGDDAKEMFRSTVEEAMASGQTELAAKLLLMSQSFSESATYWQQVLDDSAAETTRTIEKAQNDAKAVSAERYSLETTYLQLVGETDELRARELNTLDASNRELQKMIWARQDEAEEAAKAAQKMAETQKAIDSVTGSFSGLRETITLDQLGTDEAKYGYFKAQADSLTRMLPELQDQEAITRAVNEIQSLTSRAYGSLDAEQKVEMGDEFLQYLSKTEDLALKSIERVNDENAKATGKAVGDAVSKEVGRIVDAIASIASESGQLSRETVEAIRRLSTQTGNTVVGTGQKYAEVNS